MISLNGQKYFNEKEASALFGLTVSWLRKIRYADKEFPYHKLNKQVFFKEDEIEQWLSENLKPM